GLRHPRPAGGLDFRRQDRRDARRADRPVRHAARTLRAASAYLRRILHRQPRHEPVRGAGRGRWRALRRRVPAFAPGAARTPARTGRKAPAAGHSSGIRAGERCALCGCAGRRSHPCGRPGHLQDSRLSTWRTGHEGSFARGAGGTTWARLGRFSQPVADALRRRPAGGGAAMTKTPNNRAWWLVLPVFVLVAFSAVVPMMTVVNYSVQDIFDSSTRFFVGADWYRQVLQDPRLHDSLLRQFIFSGCVLLIEIPLGIVIALSMPRGGRWASACLIVMAIPLLIPWNVVGTIWQIFGRADIGLLGWALTKLGISYN